MTSQKLLEFIKSGEIEKVKALLESGVKPNRKFYFFHSLESPIVLCAKMQSIELVNLLLSYGFFVDELGKDGCTALQIACYQDFIKMIEILLENNADVNFYKKSLLFKNPTYPPPICIAAFYEKKQLLKLLISRGARTDVIWKTAWYRLRIDVLTIIIESSDNVPDEVLSFWKNSSP